MTCVVPAPDGDHMVFGGAFPLEWDAEPELLESALDVWSTQRLPDNSWGVPTKHESASHETLLACPTSITADGWAMTLRHFTLGGEASDVLLATR